MAWMAFLWGKLRQSRSQCLSGQGLRFPSPAITITHLHLWSSLQRFHSTRESTSAATWTLHLVLPKPFVAYPAISPGGQTHRNTDLTPALKLWFTILFNSPSCLPGIAQEHAWIARPFCAVLKGLLTAGNSPWKGLTGKSLPTTIDELIAWTRGFSLGAVLCSLVSLHPPLQNEMLLNYQLLFICMFLTFY